MGLEQQEGNHLPLLAHQHVERAAGGAGVHDFESDTGLEEPGAESRVRENLALAGAEQNDLGFEAQNVGGLFVGEAAHLDERGLRLNGRGGDDQRLLVQLIVDANLAAAIAADDIDVGS